MTSNFKPTFELRYKRQWTEPAVLQQKWVCGPVVNESDDLDYEIGEWYWNNHEVIEKVEVLDGWMYTTQEFEWRDVPTVDPL